MADALKTHVEQCPKHPMSHLRAKLGAAEKVVWPTLLEIVRALGWSGAALESAAAQARFRRASIVLDLFQRKRLAAYDRAQAGETK